MARLNMAGAGNAQNNINLINPRFQANALRVIRGQDCGVIDMSFFSATSANGSSRTPNNEYMWPFSYETNTLGTGVTATIGKGMATAYGYDIQNEGEVTFNLAKSSLQNKTLAHYIYLEWDLANPDEAVGSIKVQSTYGAWAPAFTDNLITNPLGKYQLILYKITMSTSGLSRISQEFGDNGTPLVSVLRAKNANHAEQADHATSATSAENSTYADYCRNNSSAGTIDSRLKDLNTRLSKLGFKTGTLTGDYIYASSLKKLGNVVYGEITFQPCKATLGTLPEGFRPYIQIEIPFTYIVSSYNYSVEQKTPYDSKLIISTKGQVTLSNYNTNTIWTKTVYQLYFHFDTTAGNY